MKKTIKSLDFYIRVTDSALALPPERRSDRQKKYVRIVETSPSCRIVPTEVAGQTIVKKAR